MTAVTRLSDELATIVEEQVWIREVIVGEQVVAAHGSRQMPIWGPIFHQVEGDQDWGNVRLENLVKYFASIQSIQAANSSPGFELYKPH